MDAQGVLSSGGFRRLKIAVELALPDAVDSGWIRLQGGYRCHHWLLLFWGQAHPADASWS